MRAGASITDIGAATYGVIGILAALHRRHLTGRGECIETGLYETIVFWISQYLTSAQFKGVNPPPRGEHSNMGATMGWGVYQLFSTSDERQVFIAVTANRHWTGLCDILGFEDWKDAEELDSNKKRTLQKVKLAERISKAVALLSFDDICDQLYRARIPYAPVNTPLDLINERHLNEGNRWLDIAVPGHNFKTPKLPLDFCTTADFEVRDQPNALGYHSDLILENLGYSKSEVDGLKSQGVVLTSDRVLNIEGNDA